MTQVDRILDYMNRFGSITHAEAVADLGVMRLAARISDIEDLGYKVERSTEKGKNRYGEKTHYTRYSLGKDES